MSHISRLAELTSEIKEKAGNFSCVLSQNFCLNTTYFTKQHIVFVISGEVFSLHTKYTYLVSD